MFHLFNLLVPPSLGLHGFFLQSPHVSGDSSGQANPATTGQSQVLHGVVIRTQ